MNYCSRDCQKKHWKHHKKTCDKPVFVDRPIVVGDKCTRCLEVVEANENGNPVLVGCKVPHPEHLQKDLGSVFDGGAQFHQFCQACNANYTRTASGSFFKKSDTEITQGPKFCFEGWNDWVIVGSRKIWLSSWLTKTCNKRLMLLMAMKKSRFFVSVGTAFIRMNIGLDSTSRSMPNLREFQLVDVGMEQIHLAPELTPKVETISMQNPTQDDDPDFIIQCPKLKCFACYYWVPSGYLKFASNHLDKVRLHRAECMQYLELYAPRLTMLDVQAAYDLEEINFVDTHPVLSQKLPRNFQFEEELHVNVVNACLGRKAQRAIVNHARFHGELCENDEDDDDFGFGGGNPMEAMFRQMHGGGGGGFF